jgi:hypothetical protein
VEIRKPAIIFFSLKAFTLISLLISALVIYGGGNFIHDFKHAFVNWDAIWCLKIAAEGYDLPRKCVFFPLMPLIIKIFSLVLRDYAWAGIAAANMLGFAGALYFYNLIRDSHGEKPAATALVLFLAAPTALFYFNLYAESLFFLLSVMVFYFAGKKQWLAAAASAGLASASRNYGVLLVLPLLWEFFSGGRKDKGLWIKAIGLFFISVSGLLLYSAYLYLTQKDPLLFINGQSLWHGRDRLAMPFTALIVRLSDLPGLFRFKTDEMRTSLNVLYYFSAIALNIYSFGKIRRPEFMYLAIMVIFLSFQPLLMSLSRYISAVFPVWAIAAIFISGRRSFGIWAFCSVTCLLIWQAVINFRWMAGLWVG